MGLDMYLYKRQKAPILMNSHYTIHEEPEKICYWRKASMIRKWLIDHAGYQNDWNCEMYKLTEDQLRDLLDTCIVVHHNHSLAERLLPLQDGYFFGGTTYNESYFEEIERTIKELRTVLTDTDFNAYDVYYYEWW